MSQIAAHFDREAEGYPTSIGTDYIQARKWALIDAHAPDAGRVADVGAANGRHTLEIAKRPLAIVAVDPSQKMLARLSRLAETQDLDGTILPCAAALPALPMTGPAFDLIYCFSTMLLLSPQDQEAAIAEMAGLLRPGGSLIVDIAGARSLAIRYWHRHYRRRGLAGVFGHSAPRTREMLEQNGLKIISMEAHGVLSQFLLAPGLERIQGLVRRTRGSESKPGWDAAISRRLPALAERWYVVARRAGGTR